MSWEAVCVLHFRGTAEVLGRANELCQSDCFAERRLGANILGQLGVPERTFPRECMTILLGMLNVEENTDVVEAILVALGHLKQPEAIEPASRLRTHPDPEVRHGVAFCLLGHDDQRAVDTLIELSRDVDAHVRDWGRFGLGAMIDLDTPAIRQVLAERLNDVDINTRSEAIVGLAQRRDPRVIPALSKELASDEIKYEVVEAATVLADPQLYPLLVALRERSGCDEECLLEAIAACTPSRASGDRS